MKQFHLVASTIFITTAPALLIAAGLPKASVQAIVKSLQDSSVDVRTAAAQALTEVPDDSAAKALETALVASTEAVEQDALVAALVKVDNDGTPKRLSDALTNPQFTWGAGAKARAVEVVGKTGDKKVIKWLTDLLSGDQEPAVRAAAIRALGAIGAPPKKTEKN